MSNIGHSPDTVTGQSPKQGSARNGGTHQRGDALPECRLPGYKLAGGKLLGRLRCSPRVALLMVLGALGLWFGFPNPLRHVPPLILLYPAALYLLGLEASSRLEALRRGWLTGLMGASAALYWLALPVHDVGGLPWPLAAPCAMAIGAYVGLYGGLFCLGAHLLRAVPPLRRAIICGLGWYLLEVLRGYFLTGFPWLSLATAFVPWPFMIQSASVVGGYGLGGLLAMASFFLAQALPQSLAPSAEHGAPSLNEVRPRCGGAASAVAGVVLLLAPAIYGFQQVAQDPVASSVCPFSDAFPVIMVEGNIDQNQKWEPQWQQATVDLYLQLSREGLAAYRKAHSMDAATGAPAPLLLWPETAMPFYFDSHPKYRPLILDFARQEGVPLLLGAPGVIRTTPRSFEIYNRAYLVNPQGQAAGHYDKAQLVPFGEFLPPWLALDFLKPLLQGVGDFTPGKTVAPLRTGNLALGPLICYESIFPEIARQRVADGANVLVNLSNDGWFGDSAAPEQHLQLAVMRAVEQGRWLLRSTNTGISAVIDHRGRVVMRGEQFKAQSLAACARRMEGLTLFHHWQPWLHWAALGLMLALCLLTRLLPKHKKA